MVKRSYQLFITIIVFINMLYSENYDYNCFTILVGKDASVDDSVLLAHNEDDHGVNLVNWYKVPRLTYNDSVKINLIAGGELKQADATNEFLWLEIPGMHFADSYMNEYGVTIVSDACRSKEDSAELVNSGIGYHLRRIMAERATSAKDAVKIAGAIVDSIGYASSGRTYCIADPNEAWMMSIVKGKHWVAQRVPNDHIAIIPNYYTIQEIDLSDTANFLGSTDIIEYAIMRGWYDPELGNEFNFRLAYGKQSSINGMVNIARNWRATNVLSTVNFNLDDEFPFSFVPKNKISIKDLMDILKLHYKDTKLEDKKLDSPHNSEILPICRKDTQYGMIAQLRNWLPSDVGNIMWLAPYRPCSQVFIPWYYGISKIHTDYYIGDYESALKNHFNQYDDIKEQTATHKFWKYVNFADRIDKDYKKLIPNVKNNKESTQQEIFRTFEEFENNIKNQYKRNQKRAIKYIDFFMKDMIEISLDYLQQ